MTSLPTRLYRAAVALLYPSHCATCDQGCDEGAAFCPSCALSVEPISSPCPGCALPTSGGARCLGCVIRRPIFSRACAPFEFGGALARAIRRLKWGGRPDLGAVLGPLLGAHHDSDCVVPVPLHPRRLRRREFNQAALLALGGRARLPPIDLKALVRIRDTPPQSALGIGDRRANVRGAFRADPRRIRGKRALVVDDVMTTGATADACAEALFDAGAVDVAVLTLARAMP
jgi:ComF family protein